MVSKESQTAGLSGKRHASCDECRSKKLKCSGSFPTCSRCERESLDCVYSAQKQMGRPKKRQAENESASPPRRTRPRPERDERRSMPPTELAAISKKPVQELSPPEGTSPALNIMGFENIFSSDGQLGTWDVGLSDLPDNRTLPGLTPNTSTRHSSTVINPAQELQNIQHDSMGNERGPETFGRAPSQLSNLNEPQTCSCLPSLYLTLHNLNTLSNARPFPSTLSVLQAAQQTALEVLVCEVCPKSFSTGVQNVHLLGVLLFNIAGAYTKLVSSIKARASTASEAGEEITLHITEPAPATNRKNYQHSASDQSHTFTVAASPPEWARLAQKAVMNELSSASPVADSSIHEVPLTFSVLLRRMELRQHHWHNKSLPEDAPRGVFDAVRKHSAEEQRKGGKEHFCLKMVKFARQVVSNMDWD